MRQSLRQLWTMTASDLRQRVRDKSVLIFGLIVPLALMFVMNLVFGGLQSLDLKAVTVAASVPRDDPLAAILVGTLEEVEAVDVTIQETPATEVRERAESGAAQLGIIIPEGFGAAATSAGGATVRVIEGDGAGIETDILIAVTEGTLDGLTAGTVAAMAGRQLGLPADQLATIGREAATEGPAFTLTQGTASSEQLSASGSLVAGQAGLFLLFTVGFGVLALVVEREQGTLARLRSMPMHPSLIVAAKGLVSYVLGAVATAVLLTIGSRFFDVSFGNVLVVGVLILCVVAAATSLVFIIARIAKSAEQANIAQSIVAVVLGMAGGAFFPISGQGVVGQLLDLNPIAAFTRGLGITAGGGGLSEVGEPILIMLGFAVVMAVVSRLVPDRGASL